ncbi:MAG: TrkA family potassium uptake protein [Clostridiales bacterium]|nr:TrkA family potassium uptake protein [Clostridiales bacterium]
MSKKAKTFAVIGLGRFGTSVAETLCALGHEVLAVDRSESRVAAIADSVTHAIVADTTDERALKRLGIRNFDCVILSVGDDIRASILSTVLMKEQGAQYVIAKASDALHARLLEKTGADKVVLPEYEAGVRLARSLVSGSIIDYLDLSDKYSITETRIPEKWAGKTLIELNVRRNYDVSVIAIRRGEEILVTLDPKAPLESGDILVMIGTNAGLSRIGHGDV